MSQSTQRCGLNPAAGAVAANGAQQLAEDFADRTAIVSHSMIILGSCVCVLASGKQDSCQTDKSDVCASFVAVGRRFNQYIVYLRTVEYIGYRISMKTIAVTRRCL